MRLLVRRVLRCSRRGERGQVTAWAVCIALVLFGFMALTTDVGFWLLDRRSAQNQVDAAALAAVQELPASDTAAATEKALEYLDRNGAKPASVCVADEDYPHEDEGVVYGNLDGDGRYRNVRVCISRGSQIFFSS